MFCCYGQQTVSIVVFPASGPLNYMDLHQLIFNIYRRNMLRMENITKETQWLCVCMSTLDHSYEIRPWESEHTVRNILTRSKANNNDTKRKLSDIYREKCSLRFAQLWPTTDNVEKTTLNDVAPYQTASLQPAHIRARRQLSTQHILLLAEALAIHPRRDGEEWGRRVVVCMCVCTNEMFYVFFNNK